MFIVDPVKCRLGQMTVAGQSRLFTPAAVYAFAMALSSGIPFLLLPVLTRVLSPAAFGMVAMFALVQTLLLPVVALGGKQAVAVHVFTRQDSIKWFLTTCLLLIAASSVCVTLLALPFRQSVAVMTHVPI